MKTAVLLTTALLAITQPLANSAFAQGVCAPVERMLDALKTDYGEQVIFHGAVGNGISMKFTASRDGSWSALLVRNGTACLRMSGEKLQPGDAASKQGQPS